MTEGLARQPEIRFSPRIDRALVDRLASRVSVSGPRDRLDVILPFTGATLGFVPRCTAEDVVDAAARAREVQRTWAERPIAERAAVLLRFHDRLLDRREEVLDLVQLESGKARGDALEELLDTANIARYYGHVAPRLLRARRRRGAFPFLTRTWEHRPPLGLVGFIAPWNYPLTLSITDALPALAAGNAALIKPDAQTPFTALRAVELLEESGLPPGLAPIVTGDGAELGPPFIARIDFLMFTGSSATGRIVGRQAGERLIGCSMELGGKNAMIVLEDADLRRAVPGAVHGCFSNAGQLCISTERLYVADAAYDSFVERFVTATKALRLGTALDLIAADVGSLVSKKQLDTVSRHVDDAVAKGARVLAGGRPRPDIGPCFYEPTILEGVTARMLVHREETFGPVVSVYRFSTEEDAIKHANDSRYGLSFSVWTRRAGRGCRVAARLQAGSVSVNDAYAAAWGSVDAPMGGVKDSGIGRRHGADGLFKFTSPQTVAVQRLVSIVEPFADRQRTAAWLVGAMKFLRHLPGFR